MNKEIIDFTEEQEFLDIIEQPYARSYAAGWWTDLETGEDYLVDSKMTVQKKNLIMTELAEAVEGKRKGLMDDKLPHRKMVEVELADAVIRALDLCAAINTVYKNVLYIDLIKLSIDSLHESEYKCNPELSFDELIYSLNRELFLIPHYEFNLYDNLVSLVYICLSTLDWCDNNGYNLVGAMKEKMEFNANRADHKIENRKKENGKKF